MTTPASSPRFVELVRVSSQGQADRDTPEIQRRALEHLRRVRPGVLVERIEALGVSGALKVEARADLRRLHELARMRAFDELRVYDIDRLTRSEDPRERFAVWGYVLDARAVIVDTSGRVTDPGDPTGMGELDFTLRSLFAAQERKRIVKRTMDGRKKNAAEGKMAGGHPPYGRDFRDGQWVINESEAATYRRMFELYLSGLRVRTLTLRLNAEGRFARCGKPWVMATVRHLLRNRHAIGEYKNLGVPCRIPAVIDEATFDRVNAMMDVARTNSGPARTRTALLRGLMTCVDCGRTMQVKIRSSHQDWAYYVCGSVSTLLDKPHPRPYTHVALVDEAIKAEVRRFLERPEVLRAAATFATSGPKVDFTAALEVAERELAKCDRDEDRTLRLIRDELLSEDVGRKELQAIQRRRAEARTQKARAEAMRRAAEAAERTVDVDASVQRIRERLASATPADWAEVFAILFPRRAPYGLHFKPGRVEGIGVLPLDARGASYLVEESQPSGSPRHNDELPFRVEARLPLKATRSDKGKPKPRRARSRRRRHA